MSTDRLSQLEKFYHEDPNDPFNIYGLALEYRKRDHQKAREFFSTLLRDHPAYIPTYYHAGSLWSEMGDTEGAKKIYENGIAQCLKSNDVKSLRELRAAYDQFMDESD
jgi:tetratricopeptide (TPR) repeat protein